MVEFHEARLDAVFRALADPTRRAMMRRLAGAPPEGLPIGALAKPFAMSLAGASKHVRALEQAGLVRREIAGRQHLCRLDSTPLAEADAWLSRYRAFWSDRLDALEAALASDPDPTARPKDHA